MTDFPDRNGTIIRVGDRLRSVRWSAEPDYFVKVREFYPHPTEKDGVTVVVTREGGLVGWLESSRDWVVENEAAP